MEKRPHLKNVNVIGRLFGTKCIGPKRQVLLEQFVQWFGYFVKTLIQWSHLNQHSIVLNRWLVQVGHWSLRTKLEFSVWFPWPTCLQLIRLSSYGKPHGIPPPLLPKRAWQDSFIDLMLDVLNFFVRLLPKIVPRWCLCKDRLKMLWSIAEFAALSLMWTSHRSQA